MPRLRQPRVPRFGLLRLFLLLGGAVAQSVNNQFLTSGLLILDSPQPNSTLDVGSTRSLAIDVSGNGLLPTPNPNVATSLLNINVFLVSGPNALNLSVSQGSGLLDGESGSTVKNVDFPLPDYLPAGAYNLTFYELSQINSAPFFTIDEVPLTLARSSSLSEASSSTCDGATVPEAQPQVDSRSPVQPFVVPGKSAFVLSTGAKEPGGHLDFILEFDYVVDDVPL